MNEENNKEVFQCICGKQFDNKKQFNGHKGGCKIYRESIKDRKLKEQQEKEYRRLPNGMFLCEKCGKEHGGNYGSGRFCCKSCYKSFTSKCAKNSGKFQQHLNDMHNSKRAVYGTWKCKQCGLIFETRHLLQKHKREYHSNIHYGAWNKGLTKETSKIILNATIKSSKKLKGKRHSQTIETREKLSKA